MARGVAWFGVAWHRRHAGYFLAAVAARLTPLTSVVWRTSHGWRYFAARACPRRCLVDDSFVMADDVVVIAFGNRHAALALLPWVPACRLTSIPQHCLMVSGTVEKFICGAVSGGAVLGWTSNNRRGLSVRLRISGVPSAGYSEGVPSVTRHRYARC